MTVLARSQITIVVINDGPTGPTGKRMLTGMVHYQLSNASAPAKPSATSFNIATRVFSGLTANWAIDSPVYASGNANKYWYCTYTVEESASGSGTGTPIFGTVKQAIGFSGLVTFTGDQAVSDGTKTLSFGASGATKIDGGNIDTGTVSADRIDVDNLVVKQAVIGKIQEVASPTAAALDAAIKVGGRNYFVIQNIGIYRDGVINTARSINNNAPAVRMLHDGTFRFAENFVASIADGHYGDSVSVQGTTINIVGNPDGLVGNAIPVDAGSELLMYGKTSLSEIDIHYKYDNGDQQSISIETENQLFEHKFTVPEGATELVLGIGQYPYAAPYTLDRIMIIQGNKQIDYIASVEDVMRDVDLKNTQTEDRLQQFIEETNKSIADVNNTLQSKLVSAATRAAEAYALAKANLAEITAKAYADGKVTEEETRAIADATAKMNEAKGYAYDLIGQLQSDLEYLIDAFADGSTYLTGGLVLSQFVGVTDGSTPTPNVVAGMAGKNFVEEAGSPVDSPMIFAGANGPQSANGAKFRVYKDGRVYAIDIYVEGSLRSPFRKVEGYWEEDGGDDNVHDNVYIDAGGSWGTPFELLWDTSQSGRRRTIVVRGGGQTLSAPSGKYFFEDGLQKNALVLNNELADIIGYADNTGFLGWVVLSRNNITTSYKYGRNLRAMAVGRIYPTSGNVANASMYKTFDGSDLTIVNTGTGVWQITMPSGWFSGANSYILSLTPESDDASEEIWIKAFERTATSFKVRTETYAALNSTTVTRAFSFIIYNIEDWNR